MYKKACPACSSEFFLSSKTEPRNVFHVNGDNSLEIIQAATDQAIHPDTICCGACSWRGSITELVESHR